MNENWKTLPRNSITLSFSAIPAELHGGSSILGRRAEKACGSTQAPERLIDFNVEYDCRPLSPCSAPKPEAFCGSWPSEQPEVGLSAPPVRTLIWPALIFCAMRRPRPISRVQTVAASP